MELCEIAFDTAAEKVKNDYHTSFDDAVTLIADEIIATAKEL